MRMIDADKFKEDLLKLWDYSSVDGITATTVLKQVISDLDNAPSVEYTFEEAFRKTVCEQRLYCPERPQGEWKDHSEEGYVECPFCEHLTTCEDNIDELHYCWNCGAELKGGAE